MHHLSMHNLRQAFRELDGSRAVGVDGVTKSQYEQKLEENLEALHKAIRGGGWKPRPSREVLIPKPQGGVRPLAIGCLEDKIVQTLMARILEAIYDSQFHRHSYGFRRGKSAHQAVGRLY
jgi:retron-type reverse transcriptase